MTTTDIILVKTTMSSFKVLSKKQNQNLKHCYDLSKILRKEKFTHWQAFSSAVHTHTHKNIRSTCYTQVLLLLTRDLKHCQSTCVCLSVSQSGQSLMGIPTLAETVVLRIEVEGRAIRREFETTLEGEEGALTENCTVK